MTRAEMNLLREAVRTTDPVKDRQMHINRQIGDYVIYSTEENVTPFFVRMAGSEMPLSTHLTVTDAVKKIQIYQESDRRFQRANG